VTEALDLLRAREHRRAELRGDSERIFEVRGRDSEWVRKSEIAAAGPVRRGRGIPYLLAPYKRDQETYWVQAAHREPEFKLPGKATIKSENLIECYGALPAEAQNELDYLWFGTARLIDVLEDLAGGPVSLEHVEVLHEVSSLLEERLQSIIGRALARGDPESTPFSEADIRTRAAEKKQDRQFRTYVDADMQAEIAEYRKDLRKATMSARVKADAKVLAATRAAEQNRIPPAARGMGGAGRGRGAGSGGSSSVG